MQNTSCSGTGATTSEQTPGSLDTLGNYHKELHGWTRRRADALFESTDAILAASATPSLAHLSLVPVHAPLTPETRHMIGAPQLALVKPQAVLVNTSRGPLVDEEALANALAERRIFAAGLDVYEEEPKVHPKLLRLENVVLAPHIGSASIETRDRMAALAAENLAAVLNGVAPPNPVTA